MDLQAGLFLESMGVFLWTVSVRFLLNTMNIPSKQEVVGASPTGVKLGFFHKHSYEHTTSGRAKPEIK